MSTQKPRDIYLICQNIRSLFNVGGLFRCADVFGVSKVYLCGYTGYPPRKEISKVALGAERWIAWERRYQTHTLVKELSAQGVKIIALETGRQTIALPKVEPQFPLALVVGNEVTGVSKTILNLADQVVSIPMFGRKESLNVVVAAGVALYQFRR